MPSETSTEQRSTSIDPAHRITAAILAGGAATRLGGLDKGLQPLQGKPLIEWVLDAVARQAFTCLIVANRNRDVYARHATTVPDAVSGYLGPLAGVAAALAASTTAWVMTVPVDCPHPPEDLASRLMQAALDEPLDALVAHDGERRQPLFALYRRELAASAAQQVLAGAGVWQWQTSIGARELDFSNRRLQFHNLNLPADFAERRRDSSGA